MSKFVVAVVGALVGGVPLAQASTVEPAALEQGLPEASDVQAPEEIWTEPIIGGELATQGEWPDVAALHVANETYVACTGTLIAPTLVLTAGHCIAPGIVRVKLNSVDTTGGAGELIGVAQSIAYPNWETTYDVGLLILDTPSTIEPRMIARGCVIERYYKDTAPVELVGYGATDPQGQVYAAEGGTLLLRGSANITDSVCVAGKGCNAGVSPGGEIMLDGSKATTCFGDSGGPLYLQTEVGDFVVGVTSRGVENAATPCGVGSIYARADAPPVISWIEQQSGITLPTPTCAQDDGGGGNGDGSGDGDGGGDGGGGGGDDDTGGGGGGGGNPDPGAPEQGTDRGGPVTGGCSAGGSSAQGLWILALGVLLLGLRRRRVRTSQAAASSS